MFGVYRTALACMVVMLHFAATPYLGQYAVFGFFALSGYLMTYIMQENYGYTYKGITAYAVNRFLRIFPLYWICCFLAIAILFLLGPVNTTDINPAYSSPKTLVQWLQNLGLLLRFGTNPILISPAWALTVELFFYACIGLGLSLNKKISFIWFFLSVIYTVYLNYIDASFGIRYHTIAAASLPFSSGAAVFHWRHDLRRLLGPIAEHDFAPMGLFFLLLANWTVASGAGGLAGWGFYINYLLCAIMIVSLFHRKSLPFVSRKWDTWIGELSYPIYLTHFPLGFLLFWGFNKLGFEFSGPNWAFFFLSMPMLLIFSWALASWIERPVELLRSAIKRSI